MRKLTAIITIIMAMAFTVPSFAQAKKGTGGGNIFADFKNFMAQREGKSRTKAAKGTTMECKTKCDKAVKK